MLDFSYFHVNLARVRLISVYNRKPSILFDRTYSYDSAHITHFDSTQLFFYRHNLYESLQNSNDLQLEFLVSLVRRAFYIVDQYMGDVDCKYASTLNKMVST